MQRARGIERVLGDYGALREGYYREFMPAPDLRSVVACNWVSVVRQGKFGAAIPVIPDGCSDILLFDAGAPEVVGPDTTMRWVALRDGLVITGLRLRPGAVRAVFGCAATTLLDEQALLRDLCWVPTQLLDGLNRADTVQRRHQLLEQWLRNKLRDVSAEDRAVLAACRALSTDPRLPIDALSRQLGWHARTLHRQFVAACGYGPKHLQRVMRVQNALRVQASALNLAQLASQAGFADQAHMTREFRALTGFTPAAYLAAHTPEVGAWLADEWSQ